jgi:hypothetical protein
MGMRSAFRSLLILLLPSLACVTEIVTAEPKSFALFTTSYNTSGDLVRGGVNGTVFFISPTRAVTANHVMNRKAFKPLPGFERVKVWLVHEGYRPVELKPENFRSNPSHDVTIIDLPKSKAVDRRFVFPVGKITVAHAAVQSEGFVANTDGPTIERRGKDVLVTSVPRLQRLIIEGQIIRQAQIDLKTLDIDLKKSPSVQLSYRPIVGISGGPVIQQGRVVAMNSFADPGTFQQTWALQLQPGIQNFARP